MTREKIIEEITGDPQYLSYCKRVCAGADVHKDLYQYVVLYFLEMRSERLIEIHATGGLRNYIARVIYTQAYGKKSGFLRELNGLIDLSELQDFHSNIKDQEQVSVVDEMINEYDQELINECIRCEVAGIYPTAVKLYQIYEENGCYKKVSRTIGVPYRTLQYHIHGLRNKLVKIVNDKNITRNERTGYRS